MSAKTSKFVALPVRLDFSPLINQISIRRMLRHGKLTWLVVDRHSIPRYEQDTMLARSTIKTQAFLGPFCPSFQSRFYFNPAARTRRANLKHLITTIVITRANITRKAVKLRHDAVLQQSRKIRAAKMLQYVLSS